jgi:hypothetical protein
VVMGRKGPNRRHRSLYPLRESKCSFVAELQAINAAFRERELNGGNCGLR